MPDSCYFRAARVEKDSLSAPSPGVQKISLYFWATRHRHHSSLSQQTVQSFVSPSRRASLVLPLTLLPTHKRFLSFPTDKLTSHSLSHALPPGSRSRYRCICPHSHRPNPGFFHLTGRCSGCYRESPWLVRFWDPLLIAHQWSAVSTDTQTFDIQLALSTDSGNAQTLTTAVSPSTNGYSTPASAFTPGNYTINLIGDSQYSTGVLAQSKWFLITAAAVTSSARASSAAQASTIPAVAASSIASQASTAAAGAATTMSTASGAASAAAVASGSAAAGSAAASASS